MEAPVNVVPMLCRRKREPCILYTCKTLRSYMLGNEYNYMRTYGLHLAKNIG